MEPINARTQELAILLKSAFNALHAASIRYCVLRNYEELPNYTTHDVDLLVQRGELARTMEVIKETICNCGWTNVAEVLQMGTYSLYCMRADDGAVQCMTFDIVDDLPWGWMPTCDVEYVLSETIDYHGLSVVRPGVDAAVRLIKELLRGTLPKEYAREKICLGANFDPIGFARCLTNAFPESSITNMLDYARNSKLEELFEQHIQFRRELILKLHRSQSLIMLWRLICYGISRYRRFSRGSLGLFVVLLGPDGAGKTSLCDGLASRLGKLLFKGTLRYHMQFNLIPKLSRVTKLVGYKAEEIDFTQKHSGSSVKPHSPWRSLLYVAYYSLDFLLGHLRLRKEKGLGRLILFDRYFYDFYFQRRNSRLPTFVLDLFQRIVPKPDLVLLLKADPEIIYARKPELDLDEIRMQLAKAEQLGNVLASSILVRRVRTDCGIDNACDQVERAVFEALTFKKGVLVSR